MARRNKGFVRGRLLDAVWRHKFFLIAAAILVTALMMLNSARSNQKKRTGSVSLNYELASQGLNPNGTRFNIYEIKSDEVLDELRRAMGIEKTFTSDELRTMITIEPANTSSVEDRYIATGYDITLTLKGKKTEGLNAENMLSALLSVYHNYFFKHYGIKTDALDISWAGSEDLDYLEFYEVANAKVESLTSYLQEMIDQSGMTQYQMEGETFRSLKESVSNFASVQLNKYLAYVRQTSLFSDSESYKDKLVYQRMLVNMKYQQALADYQIRVKAVEDYDESMITFVMVPMYDEQNWLYMARTKIGTDTLTQKANEFSVEYKAYAEQLSGIDRDLANATSPVAGETERAKADGLIATIKTEMEGLAERIRKVSDEYISYRADNDVQCSLSGYSLISYYGFKKAVLAGAAAFILLTLGFALAGPAGKED